VRSNFEISNMKTNKYLKRTKILRMKRVWKKQICRDYFGLILSDIGC
jgi:hypothetical protein